MEKHNVKEEPTITFDLLSDKRVISVVSEEAEKTLVEISGYDLEIKFNMEYINSVEDVEQAVAGIGDLFRDLIMESLLDNKQT